MSDPELNNIRHTDVCEAKQHIHDPNYYYHDGSIVFLVGDVLFKIHTSRFAPYSSSEIFASLPPTTTQTDPTTSNIQRKESSDHNPVVLSKFKPEQFRNFLYLFYGSPVETKFGKLIRGEQITSVWTTWKYHMDVAILSYHFGMSSTRDWALERLRSIMLNQTIFQISPGTITDLVEALPYLKLMAEDDLENAVRSLLGIHILCAFSSRRDTLYPGFGGPARPPSQRNCRAFMELLYRGPTIRLGDRLLFGQILCIILQAGHKSLIWTKELTRDERAILSAVQVCLTPLPKPLDCSWLNSFTRRDETSNIPCSDMCRALLGHTANSIFTAEACEQFRLDSPLGGIDALCNLLIRRGCFFVKTAEPKKIMGSDGIAKHTICSKCRTHYLKKLDSEMSQVFSKLADLFEQVERDGYVGESFG